MKKEIRDSLVEIMSDLALAYGELNRKVGIRTARRQSIGCSGQVTGAKHGMDFLRA